MTSKVRLKNLLSSIILTLSFESEYWIKILSVGMFAIRMDLLSWLTINVISLVFFNDFVCYCFFVGFFCVQNIFLF